jgi:hypothetical protein
VYKGWAFFLHTVYKAIAECEYVRNVVCRVTTETATKIGIDIDDDQLFLNHSQQLSGPKLW